MIIVVDGIDRVGKTTLCNELSKMLGYKVFKHDGSEFDYSLMDNENETDKMSQLIDMLSITDGDIIFDRFHLSEFAYGLTDRNYILGRAFANLKLIDGKLADMNSLLIKVNPVDIDRSSMEHGRDLSLYQSMIDVAYNASTMHKCECDYKQFTDALVLTDLITQLFDSLHSFGVVK